MAAPAKWGTEHKIDRPGDMANVVVASLPGGGFILAWEEWPSSSDLLTRDILAQRHDAAGVAVGDPFVVNTTTAGLQSNPDIALLTNGNFVVSWYDANSQAKAQIFSQTGSPVGAELSIGPTAGLSTVSALTGGGFVSTTSANSVVTVRVFGQNGAPVGNEQLVAGNTAATAALPSGGFMLLVSDGTVRGQVYDAAGNPMGNEFILSQAGYSSSPALTRLSNGNLVAAWTSDEIGIPADPTNVYAQLLAPDGTPIGSRFLVNTTTGNLQNSPEIVTLQDGGFAIVWSDWSTISGVDGISVKGQRYFANGVRDGGEFQVNTSTLGDHTNSYLDILSDGRLVVAWGSQYSVYFQMFDPRTEAVFIIGTPSDDAYYGTPLGDVISGEDGDDLIDGGDGGDLIYGGSGADILTGGAGGDLIDGGYGGDLLDGGDGFDIASWLTLPMGAAINLTNQALNAYSAAGDVVINFEAFYLTNVGDHFVGDDAGQYIYGFGGADLIIGGGGSDFIDGGPGGDVIDAGDGFDYVSWNSATAGVNVIMPSVAAGTGDAYFDIVTNAEAFYMTEFDDIFVGQTGANIVFGQGGADTLVGGQSANDWLFGGEGNDRLDGGVLNDLLAGGPGNDTYVFQNYFTNGLDQVLDFVSGGDRIELNGSGFGVSRGFAFTAGVTFIASAAPSPMVAGGTLLYNTANGFLSYDIDGTGGQAAIALAQFAGAPSIQASDFIVV